MKVSLWSAGILVLMGFLPSQSQRRPGAGEIGTPQWVSGRVVLEDRALKDPATIELYCDKRKTREIHTDLRGDFSLQLRDEQSMSGTQPAEVRGSSTGPLFPGEMSSNQTCELQAVLPGFSSGRVQLPTDESTSLVNLGLIVMRPLVAGRADAVSVANLAIPNAAKKAFNRALKQEKKKKIIEAHSSLKEAVNLYPQYAAAWSELGRLQSIEQDTVSARDSFQRAIAADPTYVPPYLGLTAVYFEAAQWPQLVEITGKLLNLYPTQYPGFWLLNAASHYNLQQYDAAENSALRGLAVDRWHTVPRLEHLLATILMQKGAYASAAQHMREYAKFENQPDALAEANRQLTTIEQLSATARANHSSQEDAVCRNKPLPSLSGMFSSQNRYRRSSHENLFFDEVRAETFKPIPF